MHGLGRNIGSRIVLSVQAAREALDRALRLDPENGRCWALMGSLEQDIGNLPQAEYCFKRGTSAGGVSHATQYLLCSIRLYWKVPCK